MRTTRIGSSGDEQFRQFWRDGKPVIFVLWHSRLLPLSYNMRGHGIGTLISPSTDGEHIARVVQGWGYVVARGSSSRGGDAGLRHVLRLIRSGVSLAITPDGPRGPRQRMKPGPLIVAQITGVPIIPAAASADRAWWINSWDRFLVPRPFARIRVLYGEPLWVDRSAKGAALDAEVARVEHALNALHETVDDWSSA